MWAAGMASVVGVWLMIAPAALGYGAPASTSDRLVGPLIAAVGLIAMVEVTRPVRWVNLPLGLWLLIAPWALGYPADALWNSLIAGVAVVALSLVRGRQKGRYGGGWSSLWHRAPRAGSRP